MVVAQNMLKSMSWKSHLFQIKLQLKRTLAVSKISLPMNIEHRTPMAKIFLCRLMSVTNPDKQPRKQARSEEGQTTFLSTKMVTEKKIVEEIRYMTTTKK